MIKPYSENYINVIKFFNTSLENGLSEESVEEKRKSEQGKIFLPKEKIKLFRNMFSLKEAYLIFQIGIIISGIYFKEYLISGVLGISFLIILYIKYFFLRNNNAQIEYIDKLNLSTVQVLRGGRTRIIKSEELVRGDIVFFTKNSLIAGDIRIIKCKNIKVDESSVTGEKFLKEKFDYKMDSNPSNVGEIRNMLFKGSIIKEGEGVGVVVEVGNNTYLGNILKSLKYASSNKNSIYDEIERRISKTTVILTIISLISFNIIGLEKSLYKIFLGIYAMPLMLIFIIIINLKKNKFKAKGIDLINPSTLGVIKNINIAFLDKVGAIGKEEVLIKKAFTNFQITERDNIEYSKSINIKRILDILTIANDGTYDEEKDIGTGDIKEIEYLRFIQSKGDLRQSINYKNREIFKIGMETDKRFLTVLTKGKKGFRANSRGNLEHILSKCTHIMIDGIEKELKSEDKEKIRHYNYNFLTEGLLTEGVAYRSFDYKPSASENLESNLVFVGIIALENPLYEDAKEKIERLRNKGIVPILFTEDNKIAATSIGLKVNLINNTEEVISGVEINNLKEAELVSILSKIRIFSKVNLELKGRIITLFKKEGYKVLVTGENIGDLGSLSVSEIGVGKNTNLKIINKASDIFIKEDYLNKVFEFFEEGEKLYFKIKESFSLYFLMTILQITIYIGAETLLNKNISVIEIILCSSVQAILLGVYNNFKMNKKILLSISIFSSILIYFVF